MAFPTGWNKKHKIKIDHTKVSGSANLSNFPVLFTEANFLSSAFDNSQGKEIYTNHLYSDANLKGYWRLEDVTDEVGTNDLSNTGNVTFTTAKFSKGASLDGSSQYLGIPSGVTRLSGSMTISVWINTDSVTGDHYITSDWSYDYRNYLIYLNGAVPKLSIGNGSKSQDSTLSGVPITTGTWNHICVVRNGTTQSIFVNGVKTTQTGSYSGGVTTNARNLGAAGTEDGKFDGLIDDFAMFNRALTDAEVLGLYTGGQDLRFSSDADGATQLAHEVVNWDIVNDKAEVWVKIPTLSYTADTIIYAWYDNDTVAPQAKDLANYGSQAVWSNGYQGVWHFQNNSSDSTSNGFNGTDTSVSYTTDHIGKALSFDAVTDNVSIGDYSALKPAQALTVSAWMKTSSFSAGYDVILTKRRNYGSSPYNSYILDFYQGKAGFQTSANSADVGNRTASALSTNTRHFLVGKYDGSYNYLYVDGGSPITTSQGGNINYGTIPLTFGYYYSSGSASLIGTIDEIHISNVARTEGWITTEYNNQSSPATFATPIVSFVPKVIFIS
jgi:hypothetical protein